MSEMREEPTPDAKLLKALGTADIAPMPWNSEETLSALKVLAAAYRSSQAKLAEFERSAKRCQVKEGVEPDWDAVFDCAEHSHPIVDPACTALSAKLLASRCRKAEKERDSLAEKLREETAIVDRVWKALGISTYEQAKGKAIDEIVAAIIVEGAALSERLKAATEAHLQECGCPDEYGTLCIVGKALEEYQKP